MASLKYKDENGFWQELQVGTNVAANPMLTGTEQELTSLQVADMKYKIPASGEFITPSTATGAAISGMFTADEWSKLQANMNNKILINNEIYRLNDPGHTPGIWSYVHTGWDGTDIMDKSINVTVATGAWTLVMGQKGGGKLYLHSLEVNADNYYLNTVLYSTDNTPVENGETFLRVFGSQASCIALASTDPSSAVTEPALYWSEGDQGCKVSYINESGDNTTATNVTIYDTVTEL